MQTETQNIYIALMRQIKYRANVIEQIDANPGFGIYRQTRMEFICLQLRMILESIALACLVANSEELGKISMALTKEYRPKQILKEIESINPNCYPQPVELMEKPSGTVLGLESRLGSRYRGEIAERAGNDWLMREDIGEIYGRLGDILHAKNPLRGKVDLNYFEVEGPKWYNKIVNLVTHHKVAILNDRRMYIVVVNHENRDGNVNPGAKVQMTEWHTIEDLETIPELDEMPHDHPYRSRR